VGVIQLGKGEGFLTEALAGGIVRGTGCREDLDGNVAFQAGIVGAVDFTHPPRTELYEDAVLAKGLPRQG